MSRTSPLVYAWLGLCLTNATTACGNDERPFTPDMSALVESYDNPDGTLDQTVVSGALASLDERLGALTTLLLRQQLSDLLNELGDAVDDEPQEQPQSQPQATVDIDGNVIVIEGEAYVDVTRICDGWLQPPVAAATNGSLVLHAGLTDAGLNPVAWAEVKSCRYRADDALITLDGTREDTLVAASMYFGDDLTLDGLASARILADVDLRAEVVVAEDVSQISSDFDFRMTLDPPGLEIRVEVPDGDIILMLAEDELIRIRAGNGVFDCDLRAGRCTNERGDEVALK